MEGVYHDYFQTVFKYLFCMTHDTDLAEELTQETFYQAMKSYETFRGDCKVSVWLCQIAKHLWYKELRKRKRQTSDSFDEITNPLPSNENIEQLVIEKESKIGLY